MTLVSAVNLILSLLTIAGQVIILFGILFIIIRNQKIIRFFGKNAVIFSFIVALFATLVSLFYSEIAGYEPCKLCWFQRIFMYPQVILLAIALWSKKEEFKIYNNLVLSIIGVIIAGYHYLLQIGVMPNIPCSAVGYSVICSKMFVTNFGYITIPMMSLTAFALIITFLIFAKLQSRFLK